MDELAELIREESKGWFGDDWHGLASEADDLAEAIRAWIREKVQP